jgi:hypothetical protein
MRSICSTLAGKDFSTSFLTRRSKNGCSSACKFWKPVLSAETCLASKSSHRAYLFKKTQLSCVMHKCTHLEQTNISTVQSRLVYSCLIICHNTDWRCKSRNLICICNLQWAYHFQSSSHEFNIMHVIWKIRNS